jgi:hypothetical protein
MAPDPKTGRGGSEEVLIKFLSRAAYLQKSANEAMEIPCNLMAHILLYQKSIPQLDPIIFSSH